MAKTDQAKEALRNEIALAMSERIDGHRFFDAGLDGQRKLVLLLADAVLPIVQRREQALRKQIEALADELDREARDWTRSAHSVNAKRDAARRLRGLVSGEPAEVPR